MKTTIKKLPELNAEIHITDLENDIYLIRTLRYDNQEFSTQVLYIRKGTMLALRDLINEVSCDV